jgi:hypothetical protein
MEPPFHLLVTVQNHLFAAKGGDLYSIDLTTSKFSSSWTRPSTFPAQTDKTEARLIAADVQEGYISPGNGDSLPPNELRPAKRRRLSTEGPADATREETQSEREGNGVDTTLKWAKKSQTGRPSKMSTQDRPLITSLVVTTDENHLVTATGLDKSLRVFSYDGTGSLILLSHRCVTWQAPSHQAVVVAYSI